ncbi:MAG TPA: VWA domain-containing protein [Thermoanaerobaculia bacterium]|nr:VWA domain-containing protein [Thermoanaerobaculia bacterium]
MRLARTALFALASLAVAASALAQAKESINVTVVEVPVTVIGRDGNPVRGLTAANFELIDEGKKRATTSFDVIDFASPAASRALAPINPAARRTFLLLFDLSFSSPVSLRKAQEAARDFLAHSVLRRDLAAVGTIDVDRGFRLVTAFTTDRNLLTAAIADPSSYRASDPLQIAGSAIVEGPEPPPSGGRAGQADAEVREMNQRAGRSDDRFNRMRIEKQVGMLGGLAKTLARVPGRKQIIFLSEGFDPRLVQGREGTSQEQKVENEALSHGEIWNVDTDSRFGSTSSLTLLERMSQFFHRSDVVLHAIDIQGLRLQNDLKSGARTNSSDGLFLVANPTGGTVFRDTNDLASNFDKMLKQQEVVYVLGFQAPSSAPGKYHELKVRLVDVPGGRPSSRGGYYEAGAETAIERTLTNAQIILNDIPQSDVPMAVLAAPFPTKSKNAQIPVILEIGGPELVKGAPAKGVTAEVYVYAFDEEGIVRDSLFQRISLDLDKTGDKLRASGVKYYGTLSLPEGRYAVKSLVKVAETERKGYARIDVTVAKPDEVTVLPPFFFEDAGKWVMVKGASHDKTGAPYPFELGGEPFIPSAGVRLGSQPRRFALFVYNASPDEMTWEAKVIDPRGAAHNCAPKLISQKQTAAGDLTKLLFEFTPSGVGRGPATLDVIVKKKGSSDAREAMTGIVVE